MGKIVRLTELDLTKLVNKVINEESEVKFDMSGVEKKIKSLVKEYHMLKKDLKKYGNDEDENRMEEIEEILKSVGLKNWK